VVGRPLGTEPTMQSERVLFKFFFWIRWEHRNIETPQYSPVIIEPEATFINLRG
jgi:hypothetical protein